MVGDGPLPDPRSHDRRAELGMLNQKTGGLKNGFQPFYARAHAFGVKKIGSPNKFFASGVRQLLPRPAHLRPAIRASIAQPTYSCGTLRLAQQHTSPTYKNGKQ